MIKPFNSDKVIILYYRGFTCGKFVSNILSFNDSFVPQMNLAYNAIDSFITESLNTDNELKEIKIKQIFHTIPPTKDECKNWMYYELGCNLFWGNNFVNGHLNHKAVLLLSKGKYGFVVAHDAKELQNRLEIFPNATVIEIVNDEKIYQMSVDLKSPTPMNLDHNPPYKNSIKFEIKTLFDKDEFFKNIDQLLDNLQIKDKTLDSRVYDYYDQYIELYK